MIASQCGCHGTQMRRRKSVRLWADSRFAIHDDDVSASTKALHVLTLSLLLRTAERCRLSGLGGRLDWMLELDKQNRQSGLRHDPWRSAALSLGTDGEDVVGSERRPSDAAPKAPTARLLKAETSVRTVAIGETDHSRLETMLHGLWRLTAQNFCASISKGGDEPFTTTRGCGPRYTAEQGMWLENTEQGVSDGIDMPKQSMRSRLTVSTCDVDRFTLQGCWDGYTVHLALQAEASPRQKAARICSVEQQDCGLTGLATCQDSSCTSCKHQM